ncbi:MAG: hypothetical protein NTZ68_02690, partial [Candidatus Dependentiae bacterium]|nr:hypothetical protein [Candidatus Dependentiae bacterium]
SAAAGETFSFDIGFASFDPGSDSSAPRLWTAANDSTMSTKDDSVKQYGLSFINQLASYVAPNVRPIAIPMANSESAITYAWNGTSAIVSSVANPIWGGTFTFFDVSMQKPAFTVLLEPTKIYGVENLVRYAVTDENHKNVTELLVHDFGAVATVPDEVKTLVASGNEIYAAHAAGAFGTATSKITLLARSKFTSEQGVVPYLKLIADTQISTTTSALFGGAPLSSLASLGTSVTISNMFGQVYVGVDATAAAASCAAGVTIAQLTSDGSGGFHFDFKQIAPTSVLNPGFDTVISATAPTPRVRITNITGMKTSTGLDYMIVARDNGSGPQTIYAVPIVSTGSGIGQIADFTSVKNYFNTGGPALFSSRQFDTVISNPTQIDIRPTNLTYLTQLIVGGQQYTNSVNKNLALDAGNSIEQLYAIGDTVYVVIGNNYTNTQAPGTFQSKALFDQDGHIIGWTPWIRALGTDQQQLYSFVDRKTITGFYISAQTFANIPTFRSVHQTTFMADAVLASGDPLLSIDLFPFFASTQNQPGGVQGFFEFYNVNSNALNSHLALLFITGYGKVALYPYATENPSNSGSRIFQLSGNSLGGFFTKEDSTQHAIVAADIAGTNTPGGAPGDMDQWMFYGGISGVSVLVDPATGIGFSNYSVTPSASLVAQKIGDFLSVKKLLGGQNGFIYILTSTELFRIALDSNKFKTPATISLNPELVLSAKTLSSQPLYFLDGLLDDDLGIIGTTDGMYQLNIATKKVTKINIPNGLPAVSKLNVSSIGIGSNQDFKTLSNLYVLSNSFGTQQARLNRFVIENSVLTPFDDFLTSQPNGDGAPSSLIKFDNYMSNYFSNGTWNLASSYFLGLTQPLSGVHATPLVQQIFAGVRAGFSSSQIIMTMLSAYAPLPFAFGTNNLGGFVQESATGSLILFGNFATHANV